MRKKKFSKERFYRRLESQIINDPEQQINFSQCLQSMDIALCRMSEALVKASKAIRNVFKK